MPDIVKTGKDLEASLAKIGKELVDESMNDVLGKLTSDGFRELVSRSAKDTGFLRSQWGISIGKYPPDQVKKKPKTSKTYPDAKLSLGKRKLVGYRIFLYNNTAYASYLEHGTPKMRAQPMVAPTYQFLENQAKQLVNALNRKRIP